MFQYLLGTVSIKANALEIMQDLKFQYLLGTVSMNDYKKALHDYYPVSIPLRYGFNLIVQ